MAIKKLEVVIPEKVKAAVGSPVSGYLLKKKEVVFRDENDHEVELLELRLIRKEDGSIVRTYLAGGNVELKNVLVLGQFTQISKVEKEDEETHLTYEITEVAQDSEDVQKVG